MKGILTGRTFRQYKNFFLQRASGEVNGFSRLAETLDRIVKKIIGSIYVDELRTSGCKCCVFAIHLSPSM